MDKNSPDSVVAIIQRAGRRQNVVSADNPRAVVRLPSGNVSLQIFGFSRSIDTPVSIGMMRVVVVVVMQMVSVTVVGRPRDRFVGVRHRVRHEGHHLTRFVVGGSGRRHVSVTVLGHFEAAPGAHRPVHAFTLELITDETDAETARSSIQFFLGGRHHLRLDRRVLRQTTLLADYLNYWGKI